jgi:T-complex protein 1 subunit alpha
LTLFPPAHHAHVLLPLQSGRVRYPVRAINILKATGQSSLQSQLIKGYAINCARAGQGMPTR